MMPGLPQIMLDLGRREDGATLVMAALWLPVLLLICVFVVDVGNWFAHKRHLQMQADAAALAAAGDYQFTCNDAAVKDTANKYGGAQSSSYNKQIGGTSPSDIHLLVNSKTYHNQPSPSDDDVTDPDTCASRMIDVKLTETDLPLFFHVASLFRKLPFINAHARIQFFNRERAHVPPLAVPDSNPQSAKAIFVNQSTGAEIASVALTRNGTDANGLAIWDNSSDPVSLPAVVPKMGLRIALSGSNSTNCADELVECYDLTSLTGGIADIRAYTTAGSGQQPAPPLARSVELFPGSCPDGYFVFTTTACTIGVRAFVDFGLCHENLLPILEVGAKLTARVNNTDYPMTNVDCPLGTSRSEWVTDGAPIEVAPGSGWHGITLEWEETKGTQGEGEEEETCKATGGNKCKGTFDPDNPVHRVLSATEWVAGPIRRAQIFENGVAGANSFEICASDCDHDLVVKIGLVKFAHKNAEDVNDPLVTLRTVTQDQAGVKTRAIDCDPQKNLRDELATGCDPEYEVNRGGPCPSRADLFDSPQPWDCVATELGAAVNQVYDGMTARVHGSQSETRCINDNRWSSFPNLSPTDPRFVTVILTPFGSLSANGTGSGTVPVQRFANFYVTGWAGQGNGHQSDGICPADDRAQAGTIVGHFVKYVQTLNDGSAGSEKCDFGQLGGCLAVLTK